MERVPRIPLERPRLWATFLPQTGPGNRTHLTEGPAHGGGLAVSALELTLELLWLGIHLEVVGAKIRYEAPPGALDRGLREVGRRGTWRKWSTFFPTPGSSF